MRRAAILMLVSSGCAPTVPVVHARALQDHLARLSEAAHGIATDAARRPRCAVGDEPVSVRAADLDRDLANLAARADDHADGDWKSNEAFREALTETSDRQLELARLRAEYDSCRALSAPAQRVNGAPLPPGVQRLAAFDVSDPGAVVDRGTLADLSAHLRTRLAPRFALVPAAPIRDAWLSFADGARCDSACALSVAREVGAHKALAVRIERTEARCAVILELYDVATGVTERARTVRHGCEAETLMAGIEDAVAPLAQ